MSWVHGGECVGVVVACVCGASLSGPRHHRQHAQLDCALSGCGPLYGLLSKSLIQNLPLSAPRSVPSRPAVVGARKSGIAMSPLEVLNLPVLAMYLKRSLMALGCERSVVREREPRLSL